MCSAAEISWRLGNVWFCQNFCINLVSWVGLIDVQPCSYQISVVLAIFMAIDCRFGPKNAISWPKTPLADPNGLIIGWTKLNIVVTFERVCLGLQGPQKVSSEDPKRVKNGHFGPKTTHLGHSHLQQTQLGWKLVEQGWTLSNTFGELCLGL